MKAANLNDLWGQLWVRECLRQGIKHFCISPGSRSTPLTVAAARAKNAVCQMFTDERAAAYFALGVGRATGQPAVLICTSGTAVANYFPAVIEASVDHIPMLICSADRPPELQQTRANQTIRQHGIFGDYARWFTTMPCPTESISPTFILTTAAQAIHRTTNPIPGPVHVNFSLRKPLEPTQQFISPEYQKAAHSLMNGELPYTTTSFSQLELQPETIATVAKRLQASQQGFVIVGRIHNKPRVDVIKEQEQILSFCQRLAWPVYADIGSGLRYQEDFSSQIHHVELLMQQTSWHPSQKPDCILHLGGPIVSKQMQKYVGQHSSAHHILVQETPDRLDPSHTVNHQIKAQPGTFCRQLLSSLPTPNEPNQWLELWKSKEETIAKRAKQAAQNAQVFHEPILAQRIIEKTPPSHAIFVGNSMPVRDLDGWTGPGKNRPKIAMNRGASGIEGLLSTAMGYATGSQRPGVIYLGDISMIHDINALIQLKEHPLPLVIVISNNSGGGIFRRLPIAKHEDVFDANFLTPHSIHLAKIAEAIGLRTFVSTTEREFVEAFTDACQHPEPTLIEVITNSLLDLEWTHTVLIDPHQEGNAHDRA